MKLDPIYKRVKLFLSNLFLVYILLAVLAVLKILFTLRCINYDLFALSIRLAHKLYYYIFSQFIFHPNKPSNLLLVYSMLDISMKNKNCQSGLIFLENKIKTGCL